MPKQLLALERNGPKRLEIAWDLRWRMVTVKVDSQEIGRIEGGMEAVQKGQEFILPDGRVLLVQLKRNLFSANLEVKMDGKPVPGSSTDPESRWRTAYGILFFLAGLNIILGLVVWLFDITYLASIGLGVSSILFGLVFLVLGYFVRQKSKAALIIAIIIFTIDAISGVFLSAAATGNPGASGIVLRSIFLVYLVRGISAISELQQEQVERRRLRHAEKERF